MIILEYFKSIVSTQNLPMVLIMAFGWWSLNDKMNTMLIVDAVNGEKISTLESNCKAARSKLNDLELKYATHIGDAYIKEDEYEIE